MSGSTSASSWGNILTEPALREVFFNWRSELLAPFSGSNSFLVHGNGRSYGDCCLNDKNILFKTDFLNHIIGFDKENGILECEAGVQLNDLLNLIVPAGWFFNVTPGTKYVTLGGAVANDVHGKNHFSSGSFGHHVIDFNLMRSDGEIFFCSRENNTDLFYATIGGIGLTGILLTVKIKLLKITNEYIDKEAERFGSLNEFFEIREKSSSFEYSAAWLDGFALEKDLGRGIIFRGNHSRETKVSDANSRRLPPLEVPFTFPKFTLNKYFLRAFNFAKYHSEREQVSCSRVYYDRFFYPLDRISSWNRLYGSPGFYQYQFVIPLENIHFKTKELLKLINKFAQRPSLIVVKFFGGIKSLGSLSFPMEGWTFAIDFKNDGEVTERQMRDLDSFISECGGRVYLAKDSRMGPKLFRKGYPDASHFEKFVDPKFSSSLWRRMNE